jgi:hypothetical protein
MQGKGEEGEDGEDRKETWVKKGTVKQKRKTRKEQEKYTLRFIKS